MGTRENAALFGLLLCLPTAPTLPLNSQDIGTSGWQLVDKAILLARVGEGGGPRAEQCRLSGADRPTYALASWTHNGHRPERPEPASVYVDCYVADHHALVSA